MRFHPVAAAAAALLLALPPAHAVDGIKLIGPGKGKNGALTFPITLSEPGSYRLSAHLDVPAGSAGIVIASPDVTLDLNGFTIRGSLECSETGCPGSFAPGQDGVKVSLSAQPFAGVTVKNGVIRGMPGHGVSSTSVSEGIRIEALQLVGNGGNGLFLRHGVVTGSAMFHNRHAGLGGYTVVALGNTARRNGRGIHLGKSSGLSENMLAGNGPGAGTLNLVGEFDNIARQTGGNVCNETLCP